MTKYTIRRVTVEEVEVLADDDHTATRAALSANPGSEKYSFENLGVRVIEQHLEVARREAPPACGIDDNGLCERPVARYHYKAELRLCEYHWKTFSEGFEQTRVVVAPAPVEASEIPF